MNIPECEREAIRRAIVIGKQYGFGNIICHLQSAWASALVDYYDMDEATAIKATMDREPYPLLMHRDLIELGLWDETGKRYATKPEEPTDEQ